MKKTTLHYKTGFILFTLFLLVSCKQDNFKRPYPRLETQTAIVEDGYVVLSAEIIDKGNHEILEAGFIWGTQPDLDYGVYKYKTIIEYDGQSISFSDTLRDGLEGNTTFYFKPYIETEPLTILGLRESFYYD